MGAFYQVKYNTQIFLNRNNTEGKMSNKILCGDRCFKLFKPLSYKTYTSFMLQVDIRLIRRITA